MANNKNLIIILVLIIFIITGVYYLSLNNGSQNETIKGKTIDEKVASDIEYYTQGDHYDKFEYKVNENVVRYTITIETYTEDGRNFHGAKFLTYERNNVNEEFTLSITGGLTTRKPYQELLDFVKNNNVFDYTDKQLSDMFGSATLESGYYLGQPLNKIRAGLPAVVWREWSPNYKNLVYVYQTDNPKDLDGFRDRTFIENGENDIWMSQVVPYSYFPLYYEDFIKFNPVVFINDSEFYFITQPNYSSEGREGLASEKLKNMTVPEKEELGYGVYVYNIDTAGIRKIDDLPVSGAKYKYLTYKNQFYVYGGNLPGINKYNDKGEFEKIIEFEGREHDLRVVNFTGWSPAKQIPEGTGEYYQVANFENISVFEYTDGMTAVLDLE